MADGDPSLAQWQRLSADFGRLERRYRQLKVAYALLALLWIRFERLAAMERVAPLLGIHAPAGSARTAAAPAAVPL
jgi:hypothetical protein